MVVVTCAVLLASCFPALQDGRDEAQKLIERLRSELIQERNAAVEGLIRLGPTALPAVLEAARSSDSELAGRAMSVAVELKRQAEEAAHDAAERGKLLLVGRKKYAKEKIRPVMDTEKAGFLWRTYSRAGGTLVVTTVRNYLSPRRLPADLQFDVTAAFDEDRRKLQVKRCGRCSPRSVFVEHDGPITVRVQGVQKWYSKYVVEFVEPKNEDRRKVGDFVIEVAWPKLKITPNRPRPKSEMLRLGRWFTIELKQGAGNQFPFTKTYDVVGGNAGGGAYGGSKGWCWCAKGPYPWKPKSPAAGISMVHAECARTALIKDVARITFPFWKPIEEQFDVLSPKLKGK